VVMTECSFAECFRECRVGRASDIARIGDALERDGRAARWWCVDDFAHAWGFERARV